MAKIGEGQMKKMRRGDEVLTKQLDKNGDEIDATYHASTPEGEVTIHAGNEAIVKGSDGSISYFQLAGGPGGGKFEFREGLRFTPQGTAESFSPSEDQKNHDLALIERSFRVMYGSQDGFEEVDEEIFSVSDS